MRNSLTKLYPKKNTGSLLRPGISLVATKIQESKYELLIIIYRVL